MNSPERNAFPERTAQTGLAQEQKKAPIPGASTVAALKECKNEVAAPSLALLAHFLDTGSPEITRTASTNPQIQNSATPETGERARAQSTPITGQVPETKPTPLLAMLEKNELYREPIIAKGTVMESINPQIENSDTPEALGRVQAQSTPMAVTAPPTVSEHRSLPTPDITDSMATVEQSRQVLRQFAPAALGFSMGEYLRLSPDAQQDACDLLREIEDAMANIKVTKRLYEEFQAKIAK